MTKIGKGFRGYTTRPEIGRDWETQVGKLILNFGAVEMQTYLWLEELSDDENEVIEAAKKKFSTRLQRIIKLIKFKKCDPEVESEMLTVWGHAEHMSRFRNKIAHNPLFFSYKGGEPDGEPESVGIPTFRKSKNDQEPFTILPLVSLKKLKSAVDATKENIDNLTELLEKHVKSVSA